MYLVAIAWIYVALMMALAEAVHPNGSVLGAVVTFLLYGAAPVALVMYLLGTPLRWRERKKRDVAERDAFRAAHAAAAEADTIETAATVDAAALAQDATSSQMNAAIRPVTPSRLNEK